MTISLAFLAPDLVNAAIDGRLPHGMGVTRLTDLPPNGRASTKCSILVSANRGLRCRLPHIHIGAEDHSHNFFAIVRGDPTAKRSSNAGVQPCEHAVPALCHYQA